jgi:hypothetical protein
VTKIKERQSFIAKHKEKIVSIPDLGSASKNLSILNPKKTKKMVSKL